MHGVANVAVGGGIQVLRNTDGVGVSTFQGKSIMRVEGSMLMLLALRGGGWGSNFPEKNIT